MNSLGSTAHAETAPLHGAPTEYYDGNVDVTPDDPSGEVVAKFEEEMRVLLAQKASHNGDFSSVVLGQFDGFVAELAQLEGYDENMANRQAEIVWQSLNVFGAVMDTGVWDDDVLARKMF
ncbi:MAG: hypothetical protein ABII07_05075 [Patescibacteria group bacterium]|nr:hypothetical protein [Patescibacteria group bacterium]